MASIITATTTSGLTQSADNSGVLQLASGTGNLVTVPSVTGTAMVSGNMPAFSAYQSSNQSISNGTWTKVTLTTEEWDTNSNYASSRFTPTVAGYYQLNGRCAIDGGASGNNYASIYKNGSSYKVGDSREPSVTFGANISCLVYLNGTTDYVELYYWQQSGVSKNTLANSDATYFQGAMVRSA
jgi:hypothetical protein